MLCEYEKHKKDDWWFTSKEGVEYGFIDETGREICPCKYDWANDFKEGFAYVYVNNKYGCVDNVGKEVIPCIFEEIYIDPIRNTINFRIKNNGKWGCINRIGDVILPCIFDEMWYIDETLIYGTYNNRAVIFNVEGEIVSYENI